MSNEKFVEPAILARRVAEQHGIDLSKLPTILDMSAESITPNVHAINANCPDERLKFIFKNLVDHLHDFVRETSITTDEWMTTIEFLTATGKTCSDIRQEFILLSDVVGLSTLIDTLNNVKPPNATETTVLGPFHTEDAKDLENGATIASEGKGDYMFVTGKVMDTKGNPIAGAVLDAWETDETGLYDTQYSDRDGPDCRGKVTSAADGSYSFRAVIPVPYAIPSDGPVGKLIERLGRHVFRPAHLHFKIEAPGYEKLVTALYFKGDPYITSDAVFGVRTSLIVETETIKDTSLTLARGFQRAEPHAELKQDFILATPEECAEARKRTMPALAQ
ncbi:intradiol ring-cleavage dioxygenase [Desarmillaria tabescens]|uniref:Intradiol ring-cleavage dioxygenase n=1 Tax=Armillaria tabescens TaxID=1929756 RepID=A0AA39JDR6_ARMTA|nr:intradiol ring-cleavage dioxygenase [Desarmillaria tabescens]KAK0440916.1 intradiol ring-cleavage dioxygenase [Desarmillaria tabescens]